MVVYTLFEGAVQIQTDPKTQMAVQLIERQTSTDDTADMEDRYETRLRAMIDAKLRGQGIEPGANEPEARSNVIDLMAALKKSLGQEAAEKPPGFKAKASTPPRTKKPPAAAQAAKSPRKRA